MNATWPPPFEKRGSKKQSEGSSTAAVAIVLMLSVFLVFMSSASGQRNLTRMHGWLKQFETLVTEDRCPASCIVDLVKNGWWFYD